MAYGTKYIFTFDSEQGTPFQIVIKKNGYSGTIYTRAVGGSPVLRRDKSDSICGTSLTIPAECSVDNEFEEFKTSVPFTFLVELFGGSGLTDLIWTGHVTPELMDAPDIAPPYDVQVSCTDGLGELKYTDFPARGGATLWNHLQYLLGLTNLSLSVTYVNDLYHGSYGSGTILHNTIINLDFLEGSNCYDVLQYILQSLHATITQYNGTWLIFKETGATIVSRSGSPVISNAYVDGSTSTTAITVQKYGDMSTHSDGWWPVGHMSHSNEPPRKGIALTCNNHYVKNILSDALWSVVSGGVDSGDYWTLASAGDGIRQSITFNSNVSQKLILSVKIRNVGGGTDAGKMAVKVQATGTSYAGSQTYYLTNGSYGRRNVKTDFAWSASDTSCVLDVQAPATTDTDDDFVTIGIVLPIYRNSARDYFYVSALSITITNSDGVYEQRIYGVTLAKYEQFNGMKKTVEISNGARGDASAVDLYFTPITGGNNYVGTEEMQLGVPCDATSTASISTWYSSEFTSGMDYLSLMARDYALSIADARTREKGTLNVPVGWKRIPVAFRDDYDNTYYFIETFSWSLFNDEMEVEMISRPVSDITVSDETLVQDEATNGTNYTQSDTSSSGGGGGGGTGSVTSVALAMPSQFSVSGSPITTSGTLAVTLNSNYVIPTAGRMAILDDITTTMINHWETAYQQSHYHNNLTALNTITAAKIAAWDAAAGGGMSASDLGVPPPVVKILKADGTTGTSYIRIWHPLLAYTTDAEAVLMTKSRKCQKKVGTAQSESSNAHYPRKGWVVARGYTGGNTYTFSNQQGSFGAVELTTGMFTYIARNYTRVGTKTRSQMASMSYATWKAYGGAMFGWEKTATVKKNCYRRKFGVAIRIPNPAFETWVDEQATLSVHTQAVNDGSGNCVPRYLYSAVAPILVQITEDTSGMCLGAEVL